MIVLLQAISYGSLMTLALSNFLTFFQSRDRIFLLYSMLALVTCLGMFIENGFARLYLWPDWNRWDHTAMLAMTSLSNALFLLFSRNFLYTKQRAPRTDRLITMLAGVYIFVSFSLLLYFSLPGVWFVRVSFLLTFTSEALILFATVHTIRAGYMDAYYFLAGLSCLWFGACVAGLSTFGWLTTTAVTSQAMQIGTVFEILLFSLALSIRVHDQRNLHESAQLELSHSRKLLLESLKEKEGRLESTALERTQELEILLNNEKKLREQNDRFGAMISHEFRNPLGIIESQAALIKREDAAGINNIHKRANTILSATHRLALLFEKWLQRDRLSYATNSVRVVPIDLPVWITDVIEKCSIYHASHTLELQLSPAARHIWADEQLLHILLLNLIDNACKYSPVQSIVRVETRYQSGMTGIAVIDQGSGIPTQFHEEIFLEYFRVDPESKVRGVGLGLPFVKQIVSLHGGRTELISDAGQGSSFCVWFPQVK